MSIFRTAAAGPAGRSATVGFGGMPPPTFPAPIGPRRNLIVILSSRPRRTLFKSISKHRPEFGYVRVWHPHLVRGDKILGALTLL